MVYASNERSRTPFYTMYLNIVNLPSTPIAVSLAPFLLIIPLTTNPSFHESHRNLLFLVLIVSTLLRPLLEQAHLQDFNRENDHPRITRHRLNHPPVDPPTLPGGRHRRNRYHAGTPRPVGFHHPRSVHLFALPCDAAGVDLRRQRS